MGNFNGRDITPGRCCCALGQYFGGGDPGAEAFLGEAGAGRNRCCRLARLFLVLVEDRAGTGGT